MWVPRNEQERKAADDAVRFISSLTHTKDKWAGTPFTLMPWQEHDIVRPLFGTLLPDGRRQYRMAYIEVPRKNGKALDLATPVATPEGWSSIGALAVGDVVFDEAGLPTRVVAVSDVQSDRPCFRLRFSDGEEIVADGEHEWITERVRTERPNGKRWRVEDSIRTTSQIAASLHAWPRVGKPHWNHRIQMTAALELPPRELPLPPYVLGAWLGDGTSANAGFTCAASDEQILDEIRKEGVALARSTNDPLNAWLGERDRTQPARRLSPQARLRALGVLGNKHIPPVYLRASRAQRLALLQGLMDTDGYADPAGNCEFTSTSQRLAEGVSELLSTLGFKHRSRPGVARLRGREIGPKWRLQFVAYTNEPCFRLKRKADRLRVRKGPTRNARRQIVGVDPVETRPVRCIQVDSPSNLFLAGRKMVPTHNSELAAAILLKLLFADGVQQGEVYGAASTRDQASLVFNMASYMVEKSPILRDRAKVLPSTKRIVVTHGRSAGSFYRAIAAEAGPAHGFNASAINYDELHAAQGRALWDALTTSTAVRDEALTVAETTAGFDRSSLCWEVHSRVAAILKLRDPKRYDWLDVPAAAADDPSVFGVIYGVAENADWSQLQTAEEANPSFGITVPAEYFEREIQHAKESPAYQNTYRRLHLNQWTGQSSRWMDMSKWDLSIGNADPKRLKGRVAYSGLDLSTTTDLTAFVMCFPPEDVEKGDFKVLARFWLPEDGLQERIRRDQVPYDVWAAAGFIELTEGETVDHGRIRRQIEGDRLRFELRECAYDRWNVGNLPNDLEMGGIEMLPFGQGFKDMSWPTKELDRLVRERRLHHAGNPVLRWMADGVTVEQDAAGNIKPSKSKSTRRIDGIVALVMALSRALTMGAAKSPYAEHGVEWI